MLTDQKIKALKPKAKQYKVTDGAGMFLLVIKNSARKVLDYSVCNKRLD